ncbi:deoxynucleoside kinase [Candidatus Woesearchaeota archaeon]|nr:deoxynucleoside kinase [Candidatus Woesearchaeota archaeon]
MGFFVMIDGLDGSGKGTALDALKQWAAKKKKVLDLREYGKKDQGYPKSIAEYDVIISAEPTYVGYGKKIREELIQKNKKHSAQEIAEAFAKDREALYTKIIIPALQQGKWVFQERGIVTSLVYQPAQGVSLEKVKALPGNKLTLEHAPDLLIIMKVKPETTMLRLEKRKKKDNAIFENIAFQKKIENVYESSWLKKLFEKKGSTVVYLSTDPPLTAKDTKKEIVKIVRTKIEEEKREVW